MKSRRARAALPLLWLAASCGGGPPAPDPCAASGVCTTPPAPTCASATVSTVYASVGTCTVVDGAPACAYAQAQVDCALSGQVCGASGACEAPAGPCAVPGACTSPPAASCLGTVWTAYGSVGLCTEVGGAASCQYQPSPIDCAASGRVCGGGGACVAPSCAIPTGGGDFLLYSDYRSGSWDLRAIRADGTCDQLVAGTADDELFASWAGVPGRVAWARLGAQARVVVRDLASGVEQVLDTGPQLASTPALSQDGLLVAYERVVPGEPGAQIWTVPAAGGTPAALVAGRANDNSPVYSDTPAGRYLYFVSTRTGANEVWRLALKPDGTADGEPEQLTSGSLAVGKPAVAPDGLSFAYTWTAGGLDYRVMIHRIADGTGTAGDRVLSDQLDTEPAFSPDGSVVAVRTCRWDLGNCDVALLDAATGALRKRLTTGSALVGAPAFPR